MKSKYFLFVLILGLFTGCSSDNDAISDIPDPQGGQTENPDDAEEPGSDSQNPIYLDANGVTIKAHEWAKVGEQGTIDGVTYTIVDNAMYKESIGWGGFGPDWQVCTTRVTDMSRPGLDTEIDDPTGWFGPIQADFNVNINSWDVSNVTDMSFMFRGTTYKGPLDAWDVSNVTDMRGMFYSSQFNSDISNWDVSQVTDMSNMFAESQFNQPLDTWEVGNVERMNGMFSKSSFNEAIGFWDVSKVTTMEAMFSGNISPGPSHSVGPRTVFNQDISAWDVRSVTNMRFMFNSSEFNQDISGWDVSGVQRMQGMFMNTSEFNQDISSWRLESLRDASSMFIAALAFNQDLGGWDLSGVVQCGRFAEDTPQWILPKPVLVNCELN